MKENLLCVDCGVLGVRMAALTERQMSEALDLMSKYRAASLRPLENLKNFVTTSPARLTIIGVEPVGFGKK